MDKKQARIKAKALRANAHRQAQKQGRGFYVDLAKRFFDTIKPSQDDRVAVTLNLGDEIDLLPLMEALQNQNIPMALPRIIGMNQPIDFKAYHLGDALEYEKLGTRAPLTSAKSVTPTIIVTPMLAFNRQGYRLGYGGGFYDRSFAQMRANNHDFICVGMAYAEQEMPDLMVETHDYPLDYIITQHQSLNMTCQAI